VPSLTPSGFFFFVAEISYRGQDSIDFHEFVEQKAEFSNFFRIFVLSSPQIPDASMRWTRRTPGQYRPITALREKGGGHIGGTPPGRELDRLAKLMGILKEKWLDAGLGGMVAVITP
jgi:hypothetical protein